MVVAARVGKKPVRAGVVMLVDEVGLQLAQAGPKVIELLSLGRRTGTRYQRDFRMLRSQRGRKQAVPFDVARPPLLVANADHFQVEWLRVALCSPDRAPMAVDRPVGERDEIERVLNIFVRLPDGGGFARVELACHAAVQDRKRAGANILRQLKVFEETQAERLEVIRSGPMRELVVPTVDDRPPFANIAESLLPLITQFQPPPFHDAPAREAEKAGLHVG